jgi:hypothetical protein
LGHRVDDERVVEALRNGSRRVDNPPEEKFSSSVTSVSWKSACVETTRTRAAPIRSTHSAVVSRPRGTKRRRRPARVHAVAKRIAAGRRNTNFQSMESSSWFGKKRVRTVLSRA